MNIYTTKAVTSAVKSDHRAIVATPRRAVRDRNKRMIRRNGRRKEDL